MSCTPLVSDLIHTVRERLKPAAHVGLTLSPEETCHLLVNLRTIEELAIDAEEERSILERSIRLQARQSIPIVAVADNVIHLPIRHRLHVVGGSDGGDAA